MLYTQLTPTFKVYPSYLNILGHKFRASVCYLFITLLHAHAVDRVLSAVQQSESSPGFLKPVTSSVLQRALYTHTTGSCGTEEHTESGRLAGQEQLEQLRLSFTDGRTAFRGKTYKDLLRYYTLQRLRGAFRPSENENNYNFN